MDFDEPPLTGTVCLYVCLLAELSKNWWMDLDEPALTGTVCLSVCLLAELSKN